MSDPRISHVLPRRYRDRFREIRTTAEDGLRWYFLWECRRCGQRIKPNTAGAQSHVAKHLRAFPADRLAAIFDSEAK